MPFDAPIHSTGANLDRVLGTGLPIMLVFWQRNSEPSVSMNSPLKRVAAEFAGEALIVMMEAPSEPELCRRYGVASVPTSVFIEEGRVLATVTGAQTEDEVRAWVSHLVGRGARPVARQGPSSPLPGSAPRPQPAGHSSPGPVRTEGDGRSGDPGSRPVIVTDATFPRLVLKSQVPVLVDFWAEWCGPCKIIAPTVASLASEFAGKAIVAKLNVDENPLTAGRYNVMSIPTLLIFRDGEVVDQIVGAQPASVLRSRLARAAG